MKIVSVRKLSEEEQEKYLKIAVSRIDKIIKHANRAMRFIPIHNAFGYLTNIVIPSILVSAPTVLLGINTLKSNEPVAKASFGVLTLIAAICGLLSYGSFIQGSFASISKDELSDDYIELLSLREKIASCKNFDALSNTNFKTISQNDLDLLGLGGVLEVKNKTKITVPIKKLSKKRCSN